MSLLGWMATCALAQTSGYSIDIELLNNSFGADAAPGVELPHTDGAGAVRVGTLLQYQDDPLTVYDAVRDVELGAVVARRAAYSLGISADLSPRFTLDASLPGATSWQSEVPEFSGDGTGIGDAALGARWIPVATKRFALGTRGELRLPTGRVNAFMGERGVRVTPALLASVDLGPVTVATDARMQFRPALVTSEDLQLGPEARWNSVARVHLPDATRTALTATVLTRSGLDRFLAGGAENGIEALGGVQVRPSRDVTVDLAAGRGLNEGYGTTDLRIVSSVVYRHRPKPEPDIVIVPPPPPPPPVVADLPDPEPEPDFGDRNAVVTKTRIELAQQPKFIVDTATLLDESQPLIDEIAGLFRSNAEMAHVVIEGHASQEGSFEHNYDLSLRRAHAIWQALIRAGVDQDRISFRAKGEVEPLTQGTSEAELQRNRRVEFRIVHWHDADVPTPRPAQSVPWTGDWVAVPPPI